APAPAAEAPAADAPAAAPATDGAAAPAAAPANAEPQVGQYYVKSTTQDWTTRCLKAEQGKDPCELYQLLKDGEGNSVAEMTLIPLKNNKDVAAGATLVAPLETDLIQGLGFAVGQGEARGYPFSFCAPVGCVSRLGFTQAELDALKRGSEATLTLLPFGGNRENPVRLKLSLSGFTAAFDALSAYADEVAAQAVPAPQAAPAN
uniref:invasion associated locus B family protein n=1 Tax=Paracoccus shandongensis TaxID=2816048 RepID=UPI001A8EFD47